MLFGLIGLTIAIGGFLVDEVTAQLNGTYAETRGKEPRTLSELVLKQSLILFVGAIDGEQQDLAFEPYDYLNPSFLHEREQMSVAGASAPKDDAEAVAVQAKEGSEKKDGAKKAADEESGVPTAMKTLNTLKTLDVLPDSKDRAK